MTAPNAQPQPADAELIARWRGGDEAAAAGLIRRHAPAVARFLAAAGAGEDLEDVAQEAFFRAFRSLDRFRAGATFRTWLLTIAGNALTDLRRRRARRPVLALNDREVEDRQAGPHDELELRELEGRVQAEVQRLPPMQRDVFLLRAQQGIEYEDIARALGTSVGAARVHYHHAIKRLKRVLEK